MIAANSMHLAKVAVGLAALVASTAASHRQQPVFRGGTGLILVDVQVVDRTGMPVRGLMAGDFDVTLDRRSRQVLLAELVESGGSRAAGEGTRGESAPVSNPQSGGDQTFIVAIDESSFYPRHAPAAVRAAGRFIEKLPADIRVGVFPYPHGRGLDIARDHAVALRHLASVTGTLDAPSGDYNLSLGEIMDITARDGDALRRAAARACPQEPFRCLKPIETEAQQLAMVFESQVSQSVAGLRELLRALRALPGRKILVLVTGGLLASDRVGGRPDVAGIIGDVSQEAAEANVVLTVLHMDSSFIDKFSAGGGGVRASYMRDSAALGAGLDRLAAGAGGSLVRVEAGNGEYAFDRVLRETSAYYLLSVESEPADRDGRAHHIDVKVKAPRATVRSRMTVVIPKT